MLHAYERGSLYSPTVSPEGPVAYVLHGPEHGRARTRAPRYPSLMIDGEAVTDGEDVFTFPAQWLDGDRLLYAADGKVRERDLAGGDVHDVPFAARAAFKRSSYRRRRYDFEDRRRQDVLGIANPVLSPDGSTVAFVALNQLWTMRIGRKPQAITDDVYYKATPFWSPDGSQLAYSSDRDGSEAIYLRDVATGAERKLTGPFAGAQVRGAWSPDGGKIAFLSSIDGSGNAGTYVADVASGEVRQILTPLFEPGRPTWGPDSDVVALAAWQAYSNRFREGQSLILTVDVTTGETTWHNPYPWNTINNRKGDNGPVWSPDGRSMAYVLDDVLWVLPVDASGAAGRRSAPGHERGRRHGQLVGRLAASTVPVQRRPAQRARGGRAAEHGPGRPALAARRADRRAGDPRRRGLGRREREPAPQRGRRRRGRADRERPQAPEQGVLPAPLRPRRRVRRRDRADRDPGAVGEPRARAARPAVRRRAQGPPDALARRHERDEHGRPRVRGARAEGVRAVGRAPRPRATSGPRSRSTASGSTTTSCAQR